MYKIKFVNNILENGQEDRIKKISDNGYIIKFDDPGEYNIRIYAGDENDEGDVNVYPFFNGIKKEAIWVNDRTINSREYKVTMEDKELKVEFGGKYVCIQGIEIAPVNNITVENLKAGVHIDGEKIWVNISFECNGGSGRYNVIKTMTGSGKDPEIIKISSKNFKDTYVLPAEEYKYKIEVLDDMGFCGRESDEIKIEVVNKNIKSNTIENLKSYNEKDSIKLTWDRPKEVEVSTPDYGLVMNVIYNISGKIKKDILEKQKKSRPFEYRIYRKTDLCNFKQIGVVKAGQSTEYLDNEMIPDRVYTYGVESVSIGGKSEIKEIKTKITEPLRKKKMETLDRGAIAIKTKNGMFISFRLNGYEYMEKAGFNIYGDGEKINEKEITGATNYIHKEGNMNTIYEIKKVVNGIEEEKGYIANNLNRNFMDVKINKPDDYTDPLGNVYSYTANDASVADLDGDGEYEIILKWDCNGKDNSHKGYTGNVYIDGYKLDGTMLWRIDLGKNIRCGAHYTQFMVYDFDGDGYGEMVIKTADGTKDNLGNIIGDKDADYRNREGFIIEGPEYLSLVDGRNGEIIDTVDYDPGRGVVSEWGDSWGNRVDRFLACVAYLDGVNPSVVMCRGYYDHGRPTNLVAYDIKDKKLVKKWKFRADKYQNIEYTNQGFHNLSVADVDGDGCDEIIYGACVIDHDGTGLYSTGLEHGDAMHLGKFKKEGEGFDYFGIHEHSDCPYGIEARNPGTGEITFGMFTGRDTGRGLCAKIDPRYDGNQMWAYFSNGLYNYADGKKISDKAPESVNFAIWWDGDLLRELLDHDWFGYETGVGIPKIYKWNYTEGEMDIILSTDGVLSNNGTKGNPCIQASIFGDWREEAVFRSKDSSYLRIYTTTYLTDHRFYTFMHDPTYRLGIAWQNTAYNQPPHTGFYIGPDMEKLPVPDHIYVKPENKSVL